MSVYHLWYLFCICNICNICDQIFVWNKKLNDSDERGYLIYTKAFFQERVENMSKHFNLADILFTLPICVKWIHCVSDIVTVVWESTANS